MKMFNSEMPLGSKTLDEIEKDNLRVGLDRCHRGHEGLSVDKLIHAIRCYNDITYGVG